MTEYEITYLTSPELSDETRGELDAAIDAALDQEKGAISHSDVDGRRRLFYPIKRQMVGFSRTLNVSLEPDHLEPLRIAITRQKGVLRVAILKTPRRQEVTTAIFDEYDKPNAPAAKAKAPEKTGPKKEVSMAEVEEKIEEALEEEVK